MPRSIQSIEGAAAVLRLLPGRTHRLNLAELAGELGLPKGTVYGILRTLQSVGFVERDPESGRYQVGPALLHMGSSYLDGDELRAQALNWSDWLAAGLDKVREHGWAAAVEEFFEGEASCAAPIFDRRGVALGAIAISGRIERICRGSQPQSELVALVRSGARRISNDLGALPW